MYKTIVKRKYWRTWEALNAGDHRPVLEAFAPSFEYEFVGDTPLGGTRRTIKGVDAWFQRVFRLFPGAQFTVHETVVEGWPWRTTLAASLSVSATVAGRPYDNQFTQFARLRWGHVTHLRTLEDTQRMAVGCAAMAAAGMAEATAPPIEDAV